MEKKSPRRFSSPHIWMQWTKRSLPLACQKSCICQRYWLGCTLEGTHLRIMTLTLLTYLKSKGAASFLSLPLHVGFKSSQSTQTVCLSPSCSSLKSYSQLMVLCSQPLGLLVAIRPSISQYIACRLTLEYRVEAHCMRINPSSDPLPLCVVIEASTAESLYIKVSVEYSDRIRWLAREFRVRRATTHAVIGGGPVKR